MARSSWPLARALRDTAARLREGAHYAWGHMGTCNCGHLAQTVTALTPAEIHRRAMERHGDWSQQSLEHCPTSGLAIDHVIDEMLALGLTHADLRHLEELSDPTVLRKVPARYLRRQQREHAVQYLEAWAELVEEELREQHERDERPPSTPSTEMAPQTV